MANKSKWHIPMLTTAFLLMIGTVIQDVNALTVVRKATLPCYFSTSTTSFTLVSCTNGSLSITYTCGSNCNALSTATYTQAVGYGGTFYTRLNIDGTGRVTVYTQCTGVGGTTCELDGRIGNLSSADSLQTNTSHTWSVVARVASGSQTGFIDAGAVLNMVI